MPLPAPPLPTPSLASDPLTPSLAHNNTSQHPHTDRVFIPSVTRSERVKTARRLPWGAVPGYGPISLDANDPATIRDGLNKRLFRDLPVPSENGLLLREELSVFVDRWLDANLPAVVPLTFEESLEETNYSDARKKELTEAFESLHGAPPNRAARRKIQTFVKREMYTEWKHARLINSRSDRWKAWCLPYIRAIEKEVYKLKYFIKKVPVPERPALLNALKKSGMTAYFSDFTAFESHFTSDVMNMIECKLFRHCLRNYPSVAEMICATDMGLNCLGTRGGSRARCNARRMSGDMWTSLGNGFTNLILALFLADRQHCPIEGYVEGDDGVFVTEAILTKEMYAELGFTIKLVRCPDCCAPRDSSIAFCGLVFSEDLQVLRNPRKTLQSFGWTMTDVHAGHDVSWGLLKAKAMSLLVETPACPIVNVLASEALKRCPNVPPRFVLDGYHVPVEGNFAMQEPTPATRELFSQIYGIPVELQLLAETAIRAGNFVMLSQLLPPPPDMQEYSVRFIEAG